MGGGVDSPCVLPPAFCIRRMVFTHGLPVEAVPGYFLFQYPHAPLTVHVWIKQGRGRDVVPLYPPAVHLHESHVKTLAAGLGGGNDAFRFLPGGGVVILARHIDGKRVQAGFLPGNGLYEPGRGLWFCGGCRYGKRQYQRERCKTCFKHLLSLWFQRWDEGE